MSWYLSDARVEETRQRVAVKLTNEELERAIAPDSGCSATIAAACELELKRREERARFLEGRG